MADVAARREARRRRILENSEYRLQRITGHVNHNESPDNERSKTGIGIEAQPTTSSSNPNGILASEALMENQTVDSLIDELNADIEVEDSTTKSVYANEHDIFTLLSTSNVPHRRETGRVNPTNENGNAGSIKLNSSNNMRVSPERHDSHSASSLDNSERDLSNVNIPETTLLNGILSSRLVYVILAIVVNIMVILKLEHLFGTSIIVPFFAVMIGRLSMCKNNDASQGNNMLVAALILSNVRPDFVKVIHRLKDSFSLFSKIFRDFAVYIFTFVLLHNVLYRYWNDLDDILAFQNKPEVIFNENASM